MGDNYPMNDKIRKKVLMGCSNYWTSPFKVGSHHIAEAFVNDGWNVAFISDPVSPMHLMDGINDALSERLSVYISGGKYYMDGHVWEYVPCALLTPHNKPILKTNWVAEKWASLTYPDVKQKIRNAGFAEVDLLYIDSLNQSVWLDAIKYKKAVYRVADRSSGFRKYTPAMRKMECKIAGAVDAVIISAESLKSYAESIGAKKILYMPNGVNYEHFANGNTFYPDEYKNIASAIVVYVGAMKEWFDFELINYTAKQLPGVTFVLIGPDRIAQQRLEKLPNIMLLGKRNYKILPSYLHNAKVGIIPFNIKAHSELISSVNPLKLYEYMACGLPVVAMKWKELEKIESPARLCETRDEFVCEIKDAVLRCESRKDLTRFASKADWSERIKMIKYITE